MLSRVAVKHFKRFDDHVFDVGDQVVLAGPNNSGKTTLLQAIVVWNLAVDKWVQRRNRSNAVERTGVPITRQEFTALPLREVDQLWTNTVTNIRKVDASGDLKAGQPKPIEITLSGRDDLGDWSLGVELRRQSTEQLYAKPTNVDLAFIERVRKAVRVVHVPPFSGIGIAEPIYTDEYQDVFIGQGKAGDIVRNLLVRVAEKEENWNLLSAQIREIFGYELRPPVSTGEPFIRCEYRRANGNGVSPNFDIANAGSGFHQVLLLLAFLYARESTILLLDEPDAHLHVILQSQVLDVLRHAAGKRRCQMIVATHSEVLIDASSPASVVSFFGQKPHRLLSSSDRDEVREALRRITTNDLLAADRSPGVLYLEGRTDFALLRAWAKVLNHPLSTWFEQRPFWHNNHGRSPKEARAHFFSLRAIRKDRVGALLLDGDNRKLPDHELLAGGLSVFRWKRYEAESYLIHPAALQRFVTNSDDLFTQANAERANQFLLDELPPAVVRDPLGHHSVLEEIRASKTILPEYFKIAGMELPKSDYYQIAERMLPSEISPDLALMLNNLWAAIRPTTVHGT
jgi:predicted ATPase